MSGDPEQEYFADGLVEDIITALSRMRSLFVIARNSTFAYKGKSPGVRAVGRELGVRYVLEGSVRESATRSASSVNWSRPRPAAMSGPTASLARWRIRRPARPHHGRRDRRIEPRLLRAEIRWATVKLIERLDADDLDLRATPSSPELARAPILRLRAPTVWRHPACAREGARGYAIARPFCRGGPDKIERAVSASPAATIRGLCGRRQPTRAHRTPILFGA